MYALATHGHGPKIFEKKNQYDVPWVALIVSTLPVALAYMTLKLTSNNVFTDYLTLTDKLIGL